MTTWGYNGSTVAAVWRQEDGGPRVLASTFVTAPSGDPLQSTTDGDTEYSMLDGLGSVTGTLDAAGGVSSSTAYSVFGQPAGTGAVGLGDAYGYTGHGWDIESGTHYARARWYDSRLGRFASEDPVDEVNLYPYVANQPLDYVDPTGQMAMEYGGISKDAPMRAGLARNTVQNKQARDAIKAAQRQLGRQLDRAEIRQVHDRITGEGYDEFWDLVEIVVDMFMK